MKFFKLSILTLLALLLGTNIIFAQEEVRTLKFVYIAHDHTVPTNCLAKELKGLYDIGWEFERNAYIFYLANGNTPNIVTLNLPDNNSSDFEKLILEELQIKQEHDIIVEVDLDTIVDIFNKYDFIDQNGKLKYQSVDWTFYVGERFWNLGYHESLIAKLYWIMELDKLKEQEFSWAIYCNKSLYEETKDGGFWGTRNLANISDNFYPAEYLCE